MEWVILIGAVLLILVIRYLICVEPKIARVKEMVKEPFVCPNCGRHFHAKWYQLYFFKTTSVHLYNTAKLKCPGCGKKDHCTRSYQK